MAFIIIRGYAKLPRPFVGSCHAGDPGSKPVLGKCFYAIVFYYSFFIMVSFFFFFFFSFFFFSKKIL